MKAYMTNGTLDYLEHIYKQHPDVNLSLMHNANTALVYYEVIHKISLFREARVYDVLVSCGDLKEHGFVSMRHIPLTDDGKPIFENEWKKKNDLLTKHTELYAFRVLKPTYGNTYLVFMQWEDEYAFQEWEITNLSNEHIATDYRAGKAFTTTYSMVDLEELESKA
ncbi:Heme-degrading monooxygenase HmoB [Paraliobacillus sp. PM-2]|uniref:hypothetical protein n=1 Tax=Paraliobacillus sp. PM-2 TaxID=1462524 RepID=UPI00061C1A20|nr:hypothetical protein [Paraliobacillus sp. PM-2]CQR47028.1 Heme-degrading monooxygenase HmoB [Paraliobacillus sp. PM-2]